MTCSIMCILLEILIQTFLLVAFSFQGSVSNQCHPSSGACRCLLGFEGKNCDRCADGYYNFPNCRPCNCDPAGTRSDQCNEDGLCKCDQNGACLCKVLNPILIYPIIPKILASNVCMFYCI